MGENTKNSKKKLSTTRNSQAFETLNLKKYSNLKIRFERHVFTNLLDFKSRAVYGGGLVEQV